MGFHTLLDSTLPAGVGIMLIIVFSVGILASALFLIRQATRKLTNPNHFWQRFGKKASIYTSSMSCLLFTGLLLWTVLVGQFVYYGSVGLQQDGTMHSDGFYMTPPDEMVVIPLSDAFQVSTVVPTKNGKPIDPYQDTLHLSIAYRVVDKTQLQQLYPRLLASGSVEEFVRFHMLPCLEDPGDRELLDTRLQELGEIFTKGGIEAHIKIRHSVTDRREYQTSDNIKASSAQ